MHSARVMCEFSPCDLIQEHLKYDPWRVLVACILMNLTTGLTMRPYMWKLFERYPTARDLAEADPADVKEIIGPLGLSNRRSQHLIKMSNEYLTSRWNDPAELTGCGKYASDSWKIFCTDIDVSLNDLRDKELRRFVHWLNTGEYVPQDKRI